MVPDIINKDLNILFIGYNPGEHSYQTGYHFAGRNNTFWRLLYEAGFTPQLLKPEAQQSLLNYGVGITNIVSRWSKSSTDLSWQEMKAGGIELKQKIEFYQPKVACFLGKQVYKAYAGLPSNARLPYGIMEVGVTNTKSPILHYLGPNPSGRNTIPYAEKLHHFKVVSELTGNKDNLL